MFFFFLKALQDIFSIVRKLCWSVFEAPRNLLAKRYSAAGSPKFIMNFENWPQVVLWRTNDAMNPNVVLATQSPRPLLI